MRRVWKLAVVLLMVALAGMTYRAATRTSDDRLAAAVESAQIIQCERGNAVRAYLRLDASRNAGDPIGRRARADRLFPMLDCPATVEEGRNVPLAANADARLLAHIDAKADGR